MATQLATTDQGAAPVTFGQALNGFRQQLEQRTREFQMVLPAHITPEKLQRTIITAVQSDPELLRADRQSLILACMKAAQDGLLPDKREAALVIFTENKNVNGQWQKRQLVQYMPMVYGLRKKILQSDEVTDITAKVVYRAEVETGNFIYEEGTEAMLRHKPMLDLTPEQATDDQIIAAYSMATFKDGSKSYEVMRRFEIDKVRESSQTGATRDRKGQPRAPKGPWVDWFPEQSKKTVMRRHSKTLPMSGDILDVEARDDALYAASATAALGSVQADAPVLAPTRAELLGTTAGDPPHDQTTGEIGGGTDEDTARELDAQGFAAMEGRDADDQVGGDQGGGDEDQDPPHPGTAIADELIQRIDAADVIGVVINAEQEFRKHKEAMREGDVARVQLAIDAGKLKFKPATKPKAAKGGEG